MKEFGIAVAAVVVGIMIAGAAKSALSKLTASAAV